MRPRIVATATLLALACAGPVLAQKQTPTVVQHDKKVDFTAFRTYTYEVGHPALLQEVDARVVANLEKQLAEVGLTKATAGKGDIVVTYHSVQRTDLDLATLDKKASAPGTEPGAAPLLKVGAMGVDVKIASTGKLAWRAKIERVFSGDKAAQLQAIDDAVTQLFTVYPTKIAKK